MTLIEVTLTMFMLSLLTVLLFSAFEMGTRVFRDTTVRQSSENQLRAIKLLFERDASHTNIWNCDVRADTAGTFSRDAISMSALDDWKDDSNYDATTLRPLWNRYLVWYATTNSPTGSLYRQVISPSVPAGGLITPYPISSDPEAHTNVVYTRTLSEDVLDFKTGMNFNNMTISATIQLQAKGGQRPGANVKTEENLKVEFIFQPKNNWPQV